MIGRARTALGFLAAFVAVLPWLAPSLAFAGAWEDCKQDTDAQKRVDGCSSLLSQNDLEKDIHYRALYLLGQGYVDAGNEEKGIEYLTNAIKFDPTRYEAFAYRGSFAANKEYTMQAIKDFTNAIKLNPKKNKMLYWARGAQYDFAAFEDEALADYSQAIELDSNFLEPYIARAALHKANGRQDLAIADFRKVLELDPNNIDAKEALARYGVTP